MFWIEKERERAFAWAMHGCGLFSAWFSENLFTASWHCIPSYQTRSSSPILPERLSRLVVVTISLLFSGSKCHCLQSPNKLRGDTYSHQGFWVESLQQGFVHLALQTRRPIVPVVLTGTHMAWRKGSLRVRPAPLTVKYLSPIRTDDWTFDRINDYMSIIHDMYIKHLPESQRPLPLGVESFRSNSSSWKAHT